MNSKPHGRGRMTFPHGAVYDGHWNRGMMHGQGRFTWKDGRVYEGNFKDKEKHGKGIMWRADGSVWYDGDYKDGHPDGYGTLNYPNGAVYIGEWKGGKRHGTGTYHYKNGFVYSGAWADDKKNGKGMMTCTNKEVFIGEWVDNKRHGEGTYRFADGTVFKGRWVDDENWSLSSLLTSKRKSAAASHDTQDVNQSQGPAAKRPHVLEPDEDDINWKDLMIPQDQEQQEPSPTMDKTNNTALPPKASGNVLTTSRPGTP